MRTLVASQPCFDTEDVDWLRCVVSADIYARFLRLRRDSALFCAGLEAYASGNTHGARIKGVGIEAQLASKRRGLAALFEELGLRPDIIPDTSAQKHKETLNRVFGVLVKKGLVVRGQVEQAICADDGELYDEVRATCPSCGAKVEGLGCCASCGAPLEPSSLKGAVCTICDAPIATKKIDGWLYGPAGQKVVCAYVGSELGPTVDGEPGARFSLVFSSAASSLFFLEKQGAGGEENGLHVVHFVSKRLLCCYSQLLPGVFEAAGIGAQHVWIPVGHVEMSLENRKLRPASSKLLRHLGPDQVRYALAKAGPEQNLELELKALQKEINEKLVDTVGQLAQRVLQFAHSKFGFVPKPGALSQEDRELLGQVEEARGRFEEAFARFDYGAAYEEVFGLARRASEYYTRQAPWSLIRTNPERASTVIYVSLQVLRDIGILAYPLLPALSEAVLRALGAEPAGFGVLGRPLQTGAQIAEPRPVYSKLTEKQVEELEADCHVEEKPEVDIAEFLRLDLRVATVVSAEKVPNTKRLLKLRIRVGDKMRTIVSSIGEQYSPEELVGRKIIVVMNLKPSVFAGITSRGMLLAAEGDGIISLLTPMREIKDGAWVH